MRARAKKNKSGYTVKINMGNGDNLSISTLPDNDSFGKTVNYLMEQIKMILFRELRGSIEAADNDITGNPPTE